MKKIWNWFIGLDNTNKIYLTTALLGMGGSVFLFFHNKTTASESQIHISDITTGQGSDVNITIDTTKEEYVKKLERLYEENKKLLINAHASEKQELLTQKSALEAKLVNTNQSYKDYIASLQKQITQLEANRNLLPSELESQAIEALRLGDDKKADRLFGQVSNASITSAAEANYQRSLIAERNLKYHDALEFIQKALTLVPNNDNYLYGAGFLAYILGQYDKTIEYYNKALNIWLEILGAEHSDVARSYNNLGEAYRAKAEYDKAIYYYNKSLDIRLKILRSEHPSVATNYNNLGLVYDAKGEYDKAIKYYNKSLNIRLKIFGTEHPSVATSYNNLGVVYNDKGEYDKAISYYHKALNIRLETFRTEHPSVATSYNNLGSVYYDKKDYAKAENYLNKALVIYLKTLGENHPHTQITKKWLVLTRQAKNGR